MDESENMSDRLRMRSHGNDLGSNPSRSIFFLTPSGGFGLRHIPMFDSTRRPSKLEGFTHHHAVLRLSGLPYLFDSQDSVLTPSQSCDTRIWSALSELQNHRSDLRRGASQ